MNLLDDQKLAIKKLENLKVGALFMEPGTGKTRTAIELIASSKADFALWIVPFQTKNNLVEELEKWHLDIENEVVGVETLSSSISTFVRLYKKLSKHKHAFIISDESIKIKNVNAIRTQRVIQLSKLAEYRLVLNGTPVSKNILDLWSQFEFLSPKILKMTHNQFKDTFLEYEIISNDYGKREKLIGYENIEYLHSIIEPFIFESTLNIDIEVDNSIIKYDLNADEKEKYNLCKQEFINSLFASSASFFAGTTKMQMAYSDASDKFEKIKNIVDDKTIIFSKYVDTKHKLIEHFNKALVLTYGKGSLGLNLQKYNKIIFFDKTFDYAQLEQAKRRIYRIGQLDNVNFYMLTGNVGLERMIDLNINKKMNVITYFKNVSNQDEQAIKNLKEQL